MTVKYREAHITNGDILQEYTEKKSSLNFLELFQDSGMRANVEQIFYILYNFADLM